MAYELLYLLHYPIYLPVPHAHTIYRYTRSAPLPICPFPSSAYPMPRVCLEDLAHITIITYHTPHAYLAIISRAEVDCLARTSPSDKMPPPPRRKLTRATDPTVASLHARANPARPEGCAQPASAVVPFPPCPTLGGALTNLRNVQRAHHAAYHGAPTPLRTWSRSRIIWGQYVLVSSYVMYSVGPYSVWYGPG